MAKHHRYSSLINVSLMFIAALLGALLSGIVLALEDRSGASGSELKSTSPPYQDILNRLGTPITFITGAPPKHSIGIGDADGDGRADLVLSDNESDNIWVLQNDGIGGFGAPVSMPAGSRQKIVAVGDFNEDGINDQAVAEQFVTGVRLLFGDGTGGFHAVNPSGQATSGAVLVADFNGDGKRDLAIIDGKASHVAVALGNDEGGYGTEILVPIGAVPDVLATGDFNQDEIIDLAVADSDSKNVTILLGDQYGNFVPAREFQLDLRPASLAIGDLNGDGMADVTMIDRQTEHLSILFGDGTGGFLTPSSIVVTTDSNQNSIASVTGSQQDIYEGVASLTLSPTSITGGSGASSTGTVTLNAPAPAGGVVVTLTSSNVELAASMPSITVPEGATTATFTLATNPRYRRYSGLAFSVTISATHAATQSATLNITAQPRPADFNSGSQAGSNTQWSGLMCGGIAPIGGNSEILYDCSPASGTGFGSCTFRQECSLGCRRVPPSGGTFNDSCATTGPNAITVSRNYFVSGDHVPASVVTEAPVTIPTTGVPDALSIGVNARDFSPNDVGGLHFPTNVGATSMGFNVATSYVPLIEFVDVRGFWYDADIPPFLITNGRGGHAWVAMLPPDPPPALPIPTPVQFKIVGLNPVTGGQSSLAQLHLSGIPHGIGPTITFTSSHPAIVPAPASITPAASNILGFDVGIATKAPTANTDVTLTATDGRYTFSTILKVLVPPPPPVLSALTVNPTSVVGGNPSTATITLTAAQSSATVVIVDIIDSAPATLPSNDPPCPPSSRCHLVTVPAGATSASFTIATSAVTGQFNLGVNSRVVGAPSPGPQALLLIMPSSTTALTLSALSLNPTSAMGGNALTGTVTLSAAAPSGGAVVTLSDNSVAASVPVSVTVPAGATSANFTVTTSAVTATTNVRVSAAFNGVTLNADITLFTLLGQVMFDGNIPGGNSATGTVTLNAAAPAGGVVVSLSSANTSLVTIPNSVTVAAGQTSATFTANTVPVTSTTSVVISASLNGTTVTHTLFLVVSRAVSAVALNPSSVASGVSSTGTVTLRAAAPNGGAVVSLASSNSLFAVVPTNVTVLAGATSATFTVNTAAVTATTTVVISATYEGVTQSATLTINPTAPTGASLTSVSLSPTNLVGGSSATGTVILSAAAPTGGAVVSLSDNSSAVTVPTSVTVPAGNSSANFTVTTSTVTASTSATISAVFSGVTRTTVLTVNPSGSSTLLAPSLLSPASNATPAQPVTFDWSDVSNATSYEIQVDDSSTIAAPFRANLTVSVSQATIGGLPAQRLWWRVRAQNAAGVFGPFSSTRRFTPQATTASASLSAISVNPTSVVGGNASTGTATLTAAAPTGGAIVALSDNSTAVTVPTSVTIPAGATSTTFTVTTTSVSTSTAVTLTGTYNGTSRTATLTVTPVAAPPPAASLNTLVLNPTSVTGGATSQGTVTLTSAAPTGGAVVSLSSNATTASVPASVTIPAGATSTTFTVTTTSVSTSTTATISAVLAGVTRTAVLTINPVAAGVSLTVTATGRSGERVLSSPAGINVAVGSTQSASFATNSSITLSVSNGRDAIWSGACSSGGNKTRTCTFTITGNASVTGNVQ